MSVFVSVYGCGFGCGFGNGNGNAVTAFSDDNVVVDVCHIAQMKIQKRRGNHLPL